MRFDVCIRTFKDRLYLAEQLKQASVKYLSRHTLILNTEERSTHFSEKFIILLYAHMLSTTSDYILILEDDMGFVESAKTVVEKHIRDNCNCIWFSIPSEKCLTRSNSGRNGKFRLLNPKGFYYSGAILLRSDVLREFIAHYFTKRLDFEFSNFDVQLSTYLNDVFGYISLVPSYFGTRPNIESSLSGKTEEKSRVTTHIDELDPMFDRNLIVPELQSNMFSVGKTYIK